MARNEQAIFTNLCLVYDGNGNILVENRKDPSWPGICFPGGHVEPGESFVEAVIREVWEETGLRIEDPRLCGVKQFYTDEGERYVVFLYRSDKFSGELKSSAEGRVFWIKRSELKKYALAADFADLVRVFEEDELSEFFCYEENGEYAKRLI